MLWVLLILINNQVVTYPTQFESKQACIDVGKSIVNNTSWELRWDCKQVL
jgi:hypothetical protein